MAPMRAGVPVARGILTCEPHGVVTTPRSTPTPCHSIGRGELGADTGISDFVAGRAGSGGDALGANLRLRSNGTAQRCSHRNSHTHAFAGEDGDGPERGTSRQRRPSPPNQRF
jgi:hypothetical protein